MLLPCLWHGINDCRYDSSQNKCVLVSSGDLALRLATFIRNLCLISSQILLFGLVGSFCPCCN